MHHKVSTKFLRLDNDVYGNPRYYISAQELACMLGVTFRQLNENRSHLHLTLYKGKKYGLGFVLTSYNLFEDLKFLKERICKILILNEKYPDLPLRVNRGQIELKAANRWKAYADSNNYFNNLNLTLNID